VPTELGSLCIARMYCLVALQMPEDLDKVKEEVDQRTVQAAPFPFDSKMEDVSQLFSQWGTVRQVRLLRYESAAVFSGRVFVEMATQAEADAVLKETIQHHGAQLRLQTKPDYQAAVDKVWAPGSSASHCTAHGRSICVWPELCSVANACYHGSFARVKRLARFHHSEASDRNQFASCRQQRLQTTQRTR
jgi:hypothetical protein